MTITPEEEAEWRKAAEAAVASHDERVIHAWRDPPPLDAYIGHFDPCDVLRLLDELSQLRAQAAWRAQYGDEYRQAMAERGVACGNQDDPTIIDDLIAITKHRPTTTYPSRVAASQVRRVIHRALLELQVTRAQRNALENNTQAAWRPDRETVARIIDPYTVSGSINHRRALEKADAILALPPPPQNPRKEEP